MRRIDTATAVADLFGPGKNGFGNGNPALAVRATRLNAEFFNAVQEELASAVEAAGLTLSNSDNTQLLQAIQLLGGKLITKSVAGGANVTLSAAENRNPIIVLTGLLTANISLIVPAVGRQWVFVNNTTGAFSVTVKTASGSGVVVIQGTSSHLYSDGASVFQVGVSSLPQSIQGASKNLLVTASGIGAGVTLSADELVVESAAGLFQTLRGVSVAINSASIGANGLDVGPLTASTWYHLWVVWNGTTTSGLLSLSASSPTLPSGYTHRAWVGCIRTDGTANKYPLGFTQVGSVVKLKVLAGSNVANVPIVASGVAGSTSVPTYVAVALGSYVPAAAVIVTGSLVQTAGLASAVAILSPNSSYGPTTSATNPPAVQNNGSSSSAVGLAYRFVREDANLYYAANSAPFVLTVDGWEYSL